MKNTEIICMYRFTVRALYQQKYVIIYGSLYSAWASNFFLLIAIYSECWISIFIISHDYIMRSVAINPLNLDFRRHFYTTGMSQTNQLGFDLFSRHIRLKITSCSLFIVVLFYWECNPANPLDENKMPAGLVDLLVFLALELLLYIMFCFDFV